MNLPDFKELAIDGIKVVELFINGVKVWASGYKNWVKFSTTNDGKTIYNGGLGYKNGYRVRSGGAEAVTSNCVCTGFIKVNPGDIVRLSGWAFSHVAAGNAINVSNKNFENIGQAATNNNYGIFASGYSAYGNTSFVLEKTGVWKWVVPPAASGVEYIRVSGYQLAGLSGADMIVTINEEIT